MPKLELEFNVYLPDNSIDKKRMIVDGYQSTTCEVKTAASRRGIIYNYYIKANYIVYESPFPIYITKFEKIK